VFVQARGWNPESGVFLKLCFETVLMGCMGPCAEGAMGGREGVNPRSDTTDRWKLATYTWWFATPEVEEDGQSEPGFPPEMRKQRLM
jgi:hypothetical protein